MLDKDLAQDELTFFHQLLREYFAARQLAKAPQPALVQVAWTNAAARPPLAEVLATLADGDPLPPLPQTGWEETTLTAAPMARDREGFIRAFYAQRVSSPRVSKGCLGVASRCAERALP